MDAGPLAQPTRRDLVRAAIAAGLIGSGAALLRPRDAVGQAQSDAELATTLLSTEMLAVFVYAHAVHSNVLTPDNERVVRHLLRHERAHVRALTAAVLRLGGTLPNPLRGVGDADKLLAASNIVVTLAQLRSENDYLRLLIRLEVVLERSYYGAMSKLQDPELQSIAAQVLAAEAQHATVLIDLLFPGDSTKSVPESFVEGNPGDAKV